LAQYSRLHRPDRSKHQHAEQLGAGRGTERVQALSADLLDVFDVHGATLLRKGDCRDILESQPRVPDPAELAALVGNIERALSDGALPERKA
jgi:hypothetical protein